MNRVLAEKVGMRKGMRVLDAGCGIGGSAIWLAKNFGAQVTGITIVEQQYERAKQLAKKHGVIDKTDFFVRDFRDTGFPDASFDVVWAIESVCYAEDKSDFLAEAYRVLKPGGRVMIADGFQKKDPLTSQEKEIMERWLEGWAVPNLATIGEFSSQIQKVGFRDIKYEDVTQNILPFSRWLYRRGLLAYPIAKILEWLKVRSKVATGNVIAAIWQYRALSRGLWTYAIFIGEKPR